VMPNGPQLQRFTYRFWRNERRSGIGAYNTR